MPAEGSSVTFRRIPVDIRPRFIQLFANKLQSEVAKGKPFDLLITGDAEIQRLNRDYRGKDSATDVLSFPAESGGRLGDIAISAVRARAQAREIGHSTEDEVRILMLHGLLHLMGFDHETDNGAMAHAEKRWRARLKLGSTLIERASA